MSVCTPNYLFAFYLFAGQFERLASQSRNHVFQICTSLSLHDSDPIRNLGFEIWVAIPLDRDLLSTASFWRLRLDNARWSS